MGPLGLGNRAFDRYIIYFPMRVSALLFGVEFGIRATDDCEDRSMGWEGFTL
jgi:hypothetical protein